jgi:peptide/nickel transport system substrate-binding protein
MRRRFLKSVLAAAVTVAGGAPVARAQKDKDTLVVGASLFTDSIAPTGGAYITLSLCYQTWEPLVARDHDDKIIPVLAERWEALSPTRWRFYLRKGVKWHDGSPLTAADVKFTIDYVIDPKQVYARKTRIAGVTGAEVVDDYTVDIKTSSPAPLLVRGLADC